MEMLGAGYLLTAIETQECKKPKEECHNNNDFAWLLFFLIFVFLISR